MKILLIEAPSKSEFFQNFYIFEPLALEYLASGLIQKGHEVEILDARIEKDIDSIFKNMQPDLVGLTGYTIHVSKIKEIASKLKSMMPDLFVVVGGHHATIHPIDFNDPNIDVVVIGEGVITLQEIVQSLENNKPLQNIKGIAIPASEMIFTEARPYTDLNELPIPARSLTEKYRHNYFLEWVKPIASIRTSLGCPFRCNFCALWSITGGQYLRRNPEHIVNELLLIKEKDVFFVDDESMIDYQRMDHLAALIEESGIDKHYYMYARVDTIIKHPDLFKKWHEIGLVAILIGLESYTNERLNKMNKKITTEQQQEAVKILKGLGIAIAPTFIVTHDFSHDDFKDLAAYVRKLNLVWARFGILTPFPGTDLYKEREKEILTKNWDLYDFMHPVFPTKLPLKEFYEEYAKLYKESITHHNILAIIEKCKNKDGYSIS